MVRLVSFVASQICHVPEPHPIAPDSKCRIEEPKNMDVSGMEYTSKVILEVSRYIASYMYINS